MTARAIYCNVPRSNGGVFGWVVQWSDGAYTFELTEEDARCCEQFPTLTHPSVMTPPIMAVVDEAVQGALLVLARARSDAAVAP